MLASEIFEQQPTANEKMLVVFSDYLAQPSRRILKRDVVTMHKDQHLFGGVISYAFLNVLQKLTMRLLYNI
jgi:hypothetical protein